MLGRAFDAFPNRVLGYTLNIGGSLIGIVAFSLISLLQLPPAVWFLIGGTGIAYLLHRDGGLTLPRGAALLAVLVAVTVPSLTRARNGAETYW